MGVSQYVPMDESDLRDEVSKVSKWAKEFVAQNRYNSEDLAISETAIYQIITKVDQRKQYFAYFHHLNISDFKEMALYAFWIVKLMPLQLKKGDNLPDQPFAFESLNPKFAVYLTIKKLRSLAKDDEQRGRINDFFGKKYMYELIYSLTYRDISKEAMILLIETIAVGLGFDPYAVRE